MWESIETHLAHPECIKRTLSFLHLQGYFCLILPRNYNFSLWCLKMCPSSISFTVVHTIMLRFPLSILIFNSILSSSDCSYFLCFFITKALGKNGLYSLPYLPLIPDFMVIWVLLYSQIFLTSDFFIAIFQDFCSPHIFDYWLYDVMSYSLTLTLDFWSIVLYWVVLNISDPAFSGFLISFVFSMIEVSGILDSWADYNCRMSSDGSDIS